MRHEYDDEQIFESNKIAARTTGRDWIARFNLSDVRAILDALTEPEDDWEACEFADIRKGDRVKLVTTSRFSLTVKTLEATAKHKDRGAWLDENSETIVCFPANGTQEKLYRIPAPVQHPDPSEHPVIIDEMGEPWFWAGLDDDYHSPTRPSTFRSPSDFTIWTPAKVVADND